MNQTDKEMLQLISNTSHMMTLTYESRVEIAKKQLPENLHNKEIKKISRVQVNGIKNWRNLKARLDGVSPNEVILAAKPGWENLSPGVSQKDGVVLFQASPVRRTSGLIQIDGRDASQEELDILAQATRPRSAGENKLRTYRLDRVISVTADGQTITR